MEKNRRYKTVFIATIIALLGSFSALQCSARVASNGITAEIYLSDSNLEAVSKNSIKVDKDLITIILNDGNEASFFDETLIEGGDSYLTIKYVARSNKLIVFNHGRKVSMVKIKKGNFNIVDFIKFLNDKESHDEIDYLRVSRIPLANKRIERNYKNTLKELEVYQFEDEPTKKALIINTGIDLNFFRPKIHKVKVLSGKTFKKLIIKGDNFVNLGLILNDDIFDYVKIPAELYILPSKLITIKKQWLKNPRTIIAKISTLEIDDQEYIVNITNLYGRDTKVVTLES